MSACEKLAVIAHVNMHSLSEGLWLVVKLVVRVVITRSFATMGKPNGNFVPKKGKMRKVMKKPAASKDNTWKSIKYVREATEVTSRGQRKDQIKWKRTLPELPKADDNNYQAAHCGQDPTTIGRKNMS